MGLCRGRGGAVVAAGRNGRTFGFFSAISTIIQTGNLSTETQRIPMHIHIDNTALIKGI